jgi:hypothetical protein
MFFGQYFCVCILSQRNVEILEISGKLYVIFEMLILYHLKNLNPSNWLFHCWNFTQAGTPPTLRFVFDTQSYFLAPFRRM